MPDDEDGDENIIIGLPENTQGDLRVSIDGVAAALKKGTGEHDDIIYLNNGGNAKLTLNDNDYDEYEIDLSHLGVGTYNFDVTFTINNKVVAHRNENITITSLEPEDEFESVDIEIGESYIHGKSTNQIIVTASENIIDKLTITIDDMAYDGKIVFDEIFIDISKLELGTHRIVVRYGENSTSEEFDVVDTIDCPYEIVYGGKDYVTLNLAGDANGNMTLSIDNKSVSNVKLVNGQAKILIPAISVGDHQITAAYTGSDYEIPELEQTVTVVPKVTLPSSMNAGEDKCMIIEIGDATGTVVFDADGTEYPPIKVNRIAKISLKDLDEGENTLYVQFMDKDNIMILEEDYEILVKPVKPRLAGGSNIKMTYGEVKTYTLDVYGTNAKPVYWEYVKIKIGKYTFYPSTNTKGRLTFKIPKKLAPGKYTIEAKYEGSTVKNSLVIKHAVKLKKVKVKKSAKKLTLKATVKNAKNKKIIFKFNGKKYNAKTNKKGVAKITIKKTVLDKLKAGKNVKYSATYDKDTVKKSVKVI